MILDDIRAALLICTTQAEVDDTVRNIVRLYGGADKVPPAVRNVVAVTRAGIDGKAAG